MTVKFLNEMINCEIICSDETCSAFIGNSNICWDCFGLSE